MIDLVRIYETSLLYKDKASFYLGRRGLLNFGVGYLSFYNDGVRIVNSVVIPVFDCLSNLVLLECRSLDTGKYMKLFNSECVIVYNSYSQVDTRVVTEGIFNAESVSQNIDVTVSAVLRASVGRMVLHFLAFLTRKELVFGFDNDSAGIDNFKRILGFYKCYYPYLNIKFLDFPYKDLNSFLVESGVDYFVNHLSPQILRG